MERTIFCSRKSKLALLSIVYTLWALFLCYIFQSSINFSTLWLRKPAFAYTYIASMFLSASMLKANGALYKGNGLKTYVKAIINAFLIIVAVALVVSSGWLVYMIVEQNILLAIVIGSVQVMLNVALLLVKEVPHSSIE